MILDVAVTEYRHTVTPHEIGLTRDRRTESILRQRYAPNWFSNPVQSQWTPDLTRGQGFQSYVDKYAEVTTQEPWDDIALFFQRAARLGQVQMPPGGLLYPVHRPILNISAMASASEGLAGWFCEDYYSWGLEIRPTRVTPDMVFRDYSTRRLALVEVKSSGNMDNPRRKLIAEMINLFKVLAPTKLLRPSRYYVGLIMVQVESPTKADLTSLVLEEA